MLAAELVVLTALSVLSSGIKTVTNLVGLAMTVNFEPPNEVTTPSPLAARVMAGPPTEVTMLSATPPTAAEGIVRRFVAQEGWNHAHVAVAIIGLFVTFAPWDASQVEALEMTEQSYGRRASSIPSERPSLRPDEAALSPTLYQEAAAKRPIGLCQDKKMKNTCQRRLLWYSKNLPRMCMNLWLH